MENYVEDMITKRFENKVKLYMTLHNFELEYVLTGCHGCNKRGTMLCITKKEDFVVFVKGVLFKKEHSGLYLCFGFLEKEE